MAVHRGRRSDISMTTDERRTYVRWWLERSGLTPTQVRELESGIWSDRPLDGTHGSFGAREGARSRQATPARPGFVFRSATGSQASDVAGDS